MSKPTSAKHNPIKKEWKGITRPFNHNIYESVGQVILTQLKSGRLQVIQKCDNNGYNMTNKQIYNNSVTAVQGLREMGVKQNDVVGIISSNHPDEVSIVLAALTLGCPINALDASLTYDEIFHYFSITKPKMIFVENSKADDVVNGIINLCHDPTVFVFETKNFKDLFIHKGNNFKCLQFDYPSIGETKNAIAILLCTSGKSKLPKCSAISHATLMEEIIQTNSEKSIYFTYSSLNFLSGWKYLLNSTFQLRTRIITTKQFEPLLMLMILSRNKVTNLSAPPEHIAELVKCLKKKRWKRLNLVTIHLDAYIIEQNLINELKQQMPFIEIIFNYSTCESGEISTRFICNDLYNVGKITDNTYVKIIDENGKNLSIRDTGEICYRKPFMKFLGYYKNAIETHQLLDNTQWIRTGDTGYFDNNQYLCVTSRKKDVFTYENYQISPDEIEHLIQQYFLVEKICVVGIPESTEYYVHDLIAVLIVKYVPVHTSAFTEQNIIDLVKDHLSFPKYLRGGVYFLDDFPMTLLGEIDREELKKMAIKLYKERNST